MHLWRNPSFAPCTMYFLIVFWTGSLLAVAIKEHASTSTEIHSSGCCLENSTHGAIAYCKRLSLTFIPRDLPPNIVALDASINKIRALRNDSFRSLRQLMTLNVGGNLISHLEVGTFLPLTNLHILDMSKNKLSNLPLNIFESNKFLSHLLLTGTNLSSVPTAALAMLPRLEKIVLAQNFIKIPDFKAFSHIEHISNIALSSNQIYSLKASDFKPLRNASLHGLNLSRNNIHSLPARLFSYLREIEYLNLGSNRLQKLHLSSLLGNVSISRFSVAGCGIQCIIPSFNSSLINSDFPTILSLIMETNNIASIPSYAFMGFNKTRTLKMGGNKIASPFVDSFCGLDSLEYLDLSHNRITSLHPGMFSCNPHLQELIISHNKINTLNPLYFQGLLVLRKLDISYNRLEYLEVGKDWMNPTLNLLDISHNQFCHINRNLLRGVLTNLKLLDISYNKIYTYSPYTFDNVPLLRELYLLSEKRQFLYRVFDKMKKLVKLDISYTRALLNSTRQFTETASLEVLLMRQNNLKSTDIFDSVTKSSLFDGLISLKKLSLNGNFLNNLEPGVFKSLSKLKELDLSKASIIIINPGALQGLASLRTLKLDENEILKPSAKFLSGMNYLASLYIRKNRIEVLDKNIFLMTPHLHNLFLSGNRLSYVQRDTFFPTNNTLLIDVSDNPFSCTCELSWFINWLHTSNINLINPNQTKCSKTSFTEVADLPILKFDPTEFCSVNVLLVTTLSFLGVMVGFLCIIAYRRRLWLSYKFFLLKVAIIGHKEIAEDFNEDNYEFHLNLMFHEAEEEWVYRVMKPALEERMPHLQNIAYGDDYLELGVFYVNAIYAAIENSFKTVLLLSNQSVNDAWFLTKLRMALEHLNDTRLNKVILIFVENIDNDHLPYLVRLFLSRNKPYMLWTDDEDGQELFWAKFEKSMRANRAFNNVIPV